MAGTPRSTRAARSDAMRVEYHLFPIVERLCSLACSLARRICHDAVGRLALQRAFPLAFMIMMITFSDQAAAWTVSPAICPDRARRSGARSDEL